MSASDNLSTKCSGLLLRSSFAILVARARHLFNSVPMPAFSVASGPSNSSDMVRSPSAVSHDQKSDNRHPNGCVSLVIQAGERRRLKSGPTEDPNGGLAVGAGVVSL